MVAHPVMLTAAEVATIAHIAVADVHRAFDEHMLPASMLSDRSGRRITPAAVPLLAFYFGTAKVLQAEARRQVIQTLASAGGPSPRRRRPVPLGGGVTVDLAPFVAATKERARKLAKARAMVVVSPEMLDGALPVIRGTRVPVYDIAASIAAGDSVDDIMASYSSLKPEHVELAVLYAQAEPPRGRPPRPLADRLSPGARMVASGVIPRSEAPPPARKRGKRSLSIPR